MLCSLYSLVSPLVAGAFVATQYTLMRWTSLWSCSCKAHKPSPCTTLRLPLSWRHMAAKFPLLSWKTQKHRSYDACLTHFYYEKKSGENTPDRKIWSSFSWKMSTKWPDSGNIAWKYAVKRTQMPRIFFLYEEGNLSREFAVKYRRESCTSIRKLMFAACKLTLYFRAFIDISIQECGKSALENISLSYISSSWCMDHLYLRRVHLVCFVYSTACWSLPLRVSTWRCGTRHAEHRHIISQ